MATPQERPRHFSMLRDLQLADFFTLANAACGMGSVFFAMYYVAEPMLTYFYIAAALAPAAFIFDVLDGRIARWRHAHSALGRELDSLSDIISFGVGPAKYFEGTPIPTSVVLTGILAWCAAAGRIGDALPAGAWLIGPGTFHPMALLFVLSGSFMISKTLRIPKF